MYPLVRRGDVVVVVLGKIGEFARVFDARDRLGYSSPVWFLQG